MIRVLGWLSVVLLVQVALTATAAFLCSDEAAFRVLSRAIADAALVAVGLVVGSQT